MNLRAIEQIHAALSSRVRETENRLAALDVEWSSAIGITRVDERVALKERLRLLREEEAEAASKLASAKAETGEKKKALDAVVKEYDEALDALEKIGRKFSDKITKELEAWHEKVLPLWEEVKTARREYDKLRGSSWASVVSASPYEKARELPSEIHNAVVFALGRKE